jgi:cytidine deaminase
MPDELTAVAEIRRLVERCRATLLDCTNELVRTAAGVLGTDGRMYTAVQVRSRNCNHCSVCAEAIAIGMALTAGTTDLVACVALVRTERGTAVWSPCGRCRELIRDHAVARIVVHAADDQLITATPADLLPWP